MCCSSLLISCSAQPGLRLAEDNTVVKKQFRDTILKINGVEVWIQKPSDSVTNIGTLLLLPGWDYDFRKWCDSTDVCQRALNKGYSVVSPQMMRSVYASAYFQESRADLRSNPTLLWLDSAIEILMRQEGLFLGRNLVLGLSTGARGVVLICEKRPGFFNAAAALSGDFDPCTIPDDRLTTLVYGPYKKFPERWKRTDNPTSGLRTFVTPIYVGHGALDKVVPLSQSERFYDSLIQKRGLHVRKRRAPEQGGTVSDINRKDMDKSGVFRAGAGNSHISLHIEANGGHNFTYWRSELPAVWEFFEAQ